MGSYFNLKYVLFALGFTSRKERDEAWERMNGPMAREDGNPWGRRVAARQHTLGYTITGFVGKVLFVPYLLVMTFMVGYLFLSLGWDPLWTLLLEMVVLFIAQVIYFGAVLFIQARFDSFTTYSEIYEEKLAGERLKEHMRHHALHNMFKH